MVRFGQHRVTRWLGVAYPIVLSVVVMATANHYLLDVVGGIVVIGVGAGVAWLFRTAARRIRPQHVSGAIEAARSSPPTATT
jgi:hypothetical protein